MLEYEFEAVFCRGLMRLTTSGHQEIIPRRAADGWRYIGYIPAVQSAKGAVEKLDMVFQRERPET